LRESVVDGELVACDSDGRPDFAAITKNHDKLCIWCFDLLGYRGEDVRQKPLVERREMLRESDYC
jgi:bifunctional non-homologous end joining protein LigD